MGPVVSLREQRIVAEATPFDRGGGGPRQANSPQSVKSWRPPWCGAAGALRREGRGGVPCAGRVVKLGSPRTLGDPPIAFLVVFGRRSTETFEPSRRPENKQKQHNRFHDQEDKQWTYHGSRTSNHQRIQLGSLGGYTREHQGSYYEPLSPVYPARAPPLHTVFPPPLTGCCP